MAYNFCLVIDMQNDFINGALGSDEAEKIVPNVVNYIKNNRAHYIFTRDTHDGEKYKKSREGKYLPIQHCIKDTDGWQINSEVMRAIENSSNTYTIVNKSTFGTFKPQEIIKSLHDYIHHGEWREQPNDIDGHDLNITIMGLDTDICVITNALIIKTAFPEANVNVVENCCAGSIRSMHEDALSVMKACQINIITEV